MPLYRKIKNKPKLIITFSDENISKKEQQRILAEYVATLMRWDMKAKKKNHKSSNPLGVLQ